MRSRDGIPSRAKNPAGRSAPAPDHGASLPTLVRVAGRPSPKRTAAFVLARVASISRSHGSAVVAGDWISTRAATATRSTARSRRPQSEVRAETQAPLRAAGGWRCAACSGQPLTREICRKRSHAGGRLMAESPRCWHRRRSAGTRPNQPPRQQALRCLASSHALWQATEALVPGSQARCAE